MRDRNSRPEACGRELTDAFFTMVTTVPGSKVLNEAYLPPATAEPSDLVKASPYLMELLQLGMDSREVQRRALGAQRLKEAFSAIPWHVEKAERYADHWNILYASRVNW